jgi:hypothetical protein
MRRLVTLVCLLTVLPTSVAYGAELDELLEKNREASYTAEQIISCSTPDGVRDAVVWIGQSGREIHVASTARQDMEIASGKGGWALSDGGAVISSASVDEEVEEVEEVEPLYVVETVGASSFLGRPATIHRLIRDGVLRATLIFDEETSAIVAASTYLADGTAYCERRFISFDPTDPGFAGVFSSGTGGLQSGEVDTALPQSAAGFDRLDLYEDDEGFTFAYYSDGFFSFAVFETPAAVLLPDAVAVEIANAGYERSFTAGQVTYVWETRAGGMALVGDMPPDLHEDILEALPVSERPGLFRRLWRSLFG